MTGLILIVVAAGVALAAIRLLPRAEWVYRAPRLGIVAWYTVLLTVAVAVGAALTEILLPWPAQWQTWCDGQAWCDGLGGARHGPVAWIGTRVVAAAASTAVLLRGARALRGTRTLARARRRHRDMVRLAGRRHTGLDATVIEHPRPAAYLAPGAARHPVVTSGAVGRLRPAELAAVVAHERAHADGHHQRLLDIVDVAALAVPRLRVVSTAREQIRRLIEMRADEIAAATHPPLMLARALVAMSAGPGPAAPAGLVAATGGDTVERLHRLMRPPHRLPRPAEVAIVAAAVALPAAPLLLAAACGWWPVLSTCHWGF